MLYLVTFVIRLRVLEFFNRSKPMHRPICQLPSFWPTNVHVLSAYNNDYKVDTIEANAGAQTRPRSWSHARFDSIDASLAQHQVCVVPLVGSLVSVRVLLDREELSADEVFELRDLHCRSAQFCNVERCRLIVIIRKPMRRIILAAFEAQIFSVLVHLLEEIEDFGIVPELR